MSKNVNNDVSKDSPIGSQLVQLITNILAGLNNSVPLCTFTTVCHAHATPHNGIQVTIKLIVCSQLSVRGMLLVDLTMTQPNIINYYTNNHNYIKII